MKPFGTSMTTKLTMRAAIALVVASAGATWCLATPAADISSAGPLTHIWVGNDLSCQAQHIADAPDYEFYPARRNSRRLRHVHRHGRNRFTRPILLITTLPPRTTLPEYTPFTPVSQTAVTGSGTTADPFKVVTIVDVAATGLQIQQTDTYVVGDEYFTTEIMISNNGADTASGVLYRAFDAFLGGSDTGYGFTKALSEQTAPRWLAL